MGFSRQEYWSGLSFPLQGIFLTQGLNSSLPHCRQILYHLSYEGGPTGPVAEMAFAVHSQDPQLVRTGAAGTPLTLADREEAEFVSRLSLSVASLQDTKH